MLSAGGDACESQLRVRGDLAGWEGGWGGGCGCTAEGGWPGVVQGCVQPDSKPELSRSKPDVYMLAGARRRRSFFPEQAALLAHLSTPLVMHWRVPFRGCGHSLPGH